MQREDALSVQTIPGWSASKMSKAVSWLLNYRIADVAASMLEGSLPAALNNHGRGAIPELGAVVSQSFSPLTFLTPVSVDSCTIG